MTCRDVSSDKRVLPKMIHPVPSVGRRFWHSHRHSFHTRRGERGISSRRTRRAINHQRPETQSVRHIVKGPQPRNTTRDRHHESFEQARGRGRAIDIGADERAHQWGVTEAVVHYAAHGVRRRRSRLMQRFVLNLRQSRQMSFANDGGRPTMPRWPASLLTRALRARFYRMRSRRTNTFLPLIVVFRNAVMMSSAISSGTSTVL